MRTADSKLRTRGGFATGAQHYLQPSQEVALSSQYCSLVSTPFAVNTRGAQPSSASGEGYGNHSSGSVSIIARA